MGIQNLIDPYGLKGLQRLFLSCLGLNSFYTITEEILDVSFFSISEKCLSTGNSLTPQEWHPTLRKLFQGSANFFLTKGADTKYFWLCGPWTVSIAASAASPITLWKYKNHSSLTISYESKVCVSPKCMCWNHNLQCNSIWWWGVRVEPQWMGLVPL